MPQDIRADSPPVTSGTDGPDPGGDPGAGQGPPISAELLVEEISIDGMCGVY